MAKKTAKKNPLGYSPKNVLELKSGTLTVKRGKTFEDAHKDLTRFLKVKNLIKYFQVK
jgi:hypothetical protein